MRNRSVAPVSALLLATPPANGDRGSVTIDLGTRPFDLVARMDPSPPKEKLEASKRQSVFVGRTSRSDIAAQRCIFRNTRAKRTTRLHDKGAGIVQCDVTFTADGELVWRYSECDLNLTTNIVNTPLNAMCSVPSTGPASTPKCCASDLTRAQHGSFRSGWRNLWLPPSLARVTSAILDQEEAVTLSKGGFR